MSKLAVQTPEDYQSYLTREVSGVNVCEVFERKDEAQIVAIVNVKPTRSRKLDKHCTRSFLLERYDFALKIELQLEPSEAQHLLFDPITKPTK